ncbi:Cytosolic phospholipase A2 epsilon [Apiospora arundinis]
MASHDTFNPRERELMIGAWHSVPNLINVTLDYDKAALLGDFNTKKTAGNNWGKLKPKIVAAANKSQIAQLNESEEKLAVAAWQCIKEETVPDYNKMVQLGVTKTKKTASNRWGDIKKKFPDGFPSTPGASPAKAKTPRSKKSTTGSKRKAAAATDVGDDGNDAYETPTKRAKCSPASSKLAMEAITSDDAAEEDDQSPLAEAQQTSVEVEAEA